MNVYMRVALAAAIGAAALSAAPEAVAARLAATPPMGWNDWAHYQCDYTANTILQNAKALVASGLAARGYDTVTIDDCWMATQRDAAGDLQANRARFPEGMPPVANAVHALGLKFGIYEDAGSETCGKFAGTGEPQGGGPAHFDHDVRLFAKWGVDYLKLDGCNVHVAPGGTSDAAYRKAYAATHAAIAASGRPIVFSESAPAYFQGKPGWYDVLAWVGRYGQLWREGSDIATFDAKHPDVPRFDSVLWNYSYNLPLGRYQKPGNWNDADFIIGGDGGMSLAQTRSQLALWSMMSAPLILSDDVAKLSPAAVHILGNRAVIRIDQDPLGRMATLIRRTAAEDVLLKPLAGGDYAVAVLNHGRGSVTVELSLPALGFARAAACDAVVQDLWTGVEQRARHGLKATLAVDDTAIWRIHPTAGCGTPARTGAIVMTFPKVRSVTGYGQCLTASGGVHVCAGTAADTWAIGGNGQLRNGHACLAAVEGKPELAPCRDEAAQHWDYRQNGNLVSASDHRCLGVVDGPGPLLRWVLQACGHNAATQIWALPN